jgi:hypothetical protein
MTKTVLAAFLLLAATKAHASVAIDNSQAVNVTVSTGVPSSGQVRSPSSTIIDLAQADSASWQMAFTCAKGSATIQQSNDAVTWTDINVAGSSLTFQQAALGTSTGNLYAIASPAYRYVNFRVTNSSQPVAAISASPCTFTAKQLLKSLTIKSN